MKERLSFIIITRMTNGSVQALVHGTPQHEQVREFDSREAAEGCIAAFTPAHPDDPDEIADYRIFELDI